MKKLYKTPVITVEELTKNDVLCASSEVDPSVFDNHALSGNDSGEYGLFDLTNIL